MRTSFFVSSCLFVGVVGISGVSSASSESPVVGHVYTENNNAEANALLVFDRAADGTLTAAGSLATGGKGAGSALGSAGAVTESADGNWLLAVNAGSNSVSLFHRSGGTWAVTDVAASGGTMPVSVTEWGGLVYVLNAGSTQNIRGFTVGGDGKLHAIAGSVRPLSSESGVGAAQIAFTPDGSELVVTEKGTNMIDTFRVDRDGSAAAGVFTASVGTTPYGFSFTPDGWAVVTDAEGGGAGAGAVTSYRIDESGASARNGAVGDSETAPCWLATSADGQWAWAANAGSGNITTYGIGNNGDLWVASPSGSDPANTGATSHPADLAVSPAGHHLFTLTTGAGTITTLTVGKDGTLTTDGTVAGIPSYGAGLVAE